MSLIHDALKKAQQKAYAQAETVKSGASALAPGSVRPPIPRRTLILIAIFIVVAGVISFSALKKKKVTSASLQPKQALSQNSQRVTQAEFDQLKQEALEAYKADQLELAWTKFTAATALDNKDPELWNNLGVVSRRQKNIKKAEEAFQKALKLRPEYPEALHNLAVVKMKQEAYDEAQQLLEKAVALNATYAEAFFHLALLAEQKEDVKTAHEYYRQFLKHQKQMPPHFLDRVRERALALEP